MVQTLALSPFPAHDLVLNASGSLTMLTGIEAIAAACVTACLTQLGECVLQTGLGLPNFGLIWVGKAGLLALAILSSKHHLERRRRHLRATDSAFRAEEHSQLHRRHQHRLRTHDR